MRISRRFKFKKIHRPQYRYRLNQFIKAPEVRLIDETGQNLGITPTAKALAMARERELDLIEVSPLANPPVAKIFDFSKLKYQEEKERRKERAHQQKIEVKGIRLSLRISRHDIETRLIQSKKFLTEGNKIRIELILKGRERQHRDLAIKIINNFIESLNQKLPIKIEQEIKIQGGQLSMLVTKK